MARLLLALLALVGSIEALKCYHHRTPLYKAFNEDKGLVECSKDQPYCLYASVTAFGPRSMSRFPPHREMVLCSSGQFFKEEGLEDAAADINICSNSPRLPLKINVTLDLEHEKQSKMVWRLNDFQCCEQDGSNMNAYGVIGGGSKHPQWIKNPFFWITKNNSNIFV